MKGKKNIRWYLAFYDIFTLVSLLFLHRDHWEEYTVEFGDMEGFNAIFDCFLQMLL